jgi:hypothetical protein
MPRTKSQLRSGEGKLVKLRLYARPPHPLLRRYRLTKFSISRSSSMGTAVALLE